MIPTHKLFNSQNYFLILNQLMKFESRQAPNFASSKLYRVVFQSGMIYSMKDKSILKVYIKHLPRFALYQNIVKHH